MMNESMDAMGRQIANWALPVCQAVGAALSMARFRGGLLTNYFADRSAVLMIREIWQRMRSGCLSAT